MNIGILYYMIEDKTKSLTDRVQDILTQYQLKYGKPPAQVLISNKNNLEDVKLPDGLKIVVKSVHLPLNHLWIEKQ